MVMNGIFECFVLTAAYGLRKMATRCRLGQQQRRNSKESFQDPNTTTRIETFNRDGSRASLTGTAVQVGNQLQGMCHQFENDAGAASLSSRPCHLGRCVLSCYSSERFNTRATHTMCCPGQPREHFGHGRFATTVRGGWSLPAKSPCEPS